MIGDRIKERRKELNMPQEKLAQLTGYKTKSAISRIENGKRQLSQSQISTFAKALRTSEAYLMEREDENNLVQNSDYMTINIYGTVPAGIPIEAIEDITGTEDLSLKNYSPNKEYIGLKVKGDSMYPKYLEGDTIIIEVTTDFFSGQDCVVYVNGYDATLKSVIKNENGTITLKPINPAYPPRTYTENDDPIKILGIVKEIRRKV